MNGATKATNRAGATLGTGSHSALSHMNWADWFSWVFLVIGGINWLLIGFFNYDLVSAIFGTGFVDHLIFALVGISALYAIIAAIVRGSNAPSRDY